MRRGAVVTAVGVIALAATAERAAAKTVSDQAYATRVCGQIAEILEPLEELRSVDSTDLAAYQEAAVDLLGEASEAAEAAGRSLEKVTPKSGGTKVARTFAFFFSERSDAYARARDQIEEGDPGDPSFQSDMRAFVDVLDDSPFGLANPLEAATVTKKKALARAFAADETCIAVGVELD